MFGPYHFVFHSFSPSLITNKFYKSKLKASSNYFFNEAMFLYGGVLG